MLLLKMLVSAFVLVCILEHGTDAECAFLMRGTARGLPQRAASLSAPPRLRPAGLRPRRRSHVPLPLRGAAASAPAGDDADEKTETVRRRRRATWARKDPPVDKAGRNAGEAAPSWEPPCMDLESVIGAVAAEIATDEEWAKVADDMLQIYTPSICRAGADAYTRRLSTADEASTLRWIRAETRRRFSAEEASMSIFPEQVRVH
jgi:hypothetical protein